MATDPSVPEPSEHATASDHRAGRFSWHAATDRWWWSEEMFAIHGFVPGEVLPTTALVLRHIHPHDVAAAQQVRVTALEDGRPFSFRHRIITAQQQERVVVATGHAELEGPERILTGHLIDVADLRRDAVNAELDRAVEDFVARRAVIEQSKGALAQLLGVDADTAWQLLRDYSQTRNIKVRDLARVLVDAAASQTGPVSARGISPLDVIDRWRAGHTS